MSGDVQPRKRKDKKRKKEDGGAEEPRGTAAALGEGDVFMHSQHEHGTGGHWCAKIVFFSLLAVLIGLIALIILENRGLSDLEANTVESRYSGVLEGWLEDASDDDHHDEHTLELNHPDIEDESAEADPDLEDAEHEDDEQKSEEFDEPDDDDDDQNLDDEDHDEDEDVDEQNHEDYESAENIEEQYNYFVDGSDEVEPDEDDKGDEYEPDNTYYEKTSNEDDNEPFAYSESAENLNNAINNYENDLDKNDDDNNENENSVEYYNDEDDEVDHDDEVHDDSDIEVEHIEHEVIDEDLISNELPALPEEDDDDEDKNSEEQEEDNFERDIDDYLEHEEIDDDDDDDVEHISAPSGKPLKEVEDSTEDLPSDTLKDEEEYEQRQEELRRQTAESSHVWLKLGVGAALLVATHAVVRRASRHDNVDTNTEDTVPEEPATVDSRMTLIPEEELPVSEQESVANGSKKTEVVKKLPILIQTSPTIDDDEDIEVVEENIENPTIIKNVETKCIESKQETPDKEMYSDDDDVDDEKGELELSNASKVLSATHVATQDNDVESDDVEIIDEDQIEEELEEEDEEEEISDVDDAELLNRLEAKYGRLPEPERPGQKYKDGGNNIEEWPGEPSDPFWHSLLDQAEEHQNLGEWEKAAQLAYAPQIDSSGRALWITASSMDKLAELRRDNNMLSRAIQKYLQLLKLNDTLTDKQLLMVTNRTIDRMNFRGTYLATESVYKLLIRRFPNEPGYYNNLTIAYLMANRPELASEMAQMTILKWPQDRLALAHYAFVLKTHFEKLPEAVSMFTRALDGDRGPAVEPRYYYHLGDALLLLERFEEAHEVHQRAAALGLFLSASQRSLYNVNRLKSKPWWEINETPYGRLAKALENSWKDILLEAEAATALYVEEKEGLRERGEWSQLDLFVRGREVPGRCKRAPVTCAIVRAEPAAVGCTRGQIKFSAIEPGTHIRAHVGPTNCRLRMHLGLKNTDNTFIRVDQETRTWEKGKVLLFDDSFEHEVWHRGNNTRIVLIVDVWHPDLTPAERRSLPPI